MGVNLKYVRRLKSGRIEYRRPFPQALRAQLGRNELIVSLGARSLAEPGAMERYRTANDNYERLVSTARKALAGLFDELDRPRIAWMVEAHVASYLATDDASRLAGTADPESHNAADDGWRDILEEGDVGRIVELLREDAIALAGQQGWLFDTSAESFATLCLELLRATIRANELRMERDRGHPVPTPLAPEPPKTSREAKARKRNSAFASLVEEEMGRPTFTGGASTKQSWQTALRYFREVHGEPAPEEITRRLVSDFADALTLAPVKRAVPRNQRDWALPKLVESYAGKEVERLTHKARGAIIGALQAAWNKCQRSGRIADELANPFARPNLGKPPAPKKNEGLTREESCAIFSLPIFTAGERPTRGRGHACYWLPVLLMVTGARPEELAQALVTDVRQDPISGEWSLVISAEGNHPHKGKRALKTPSAERTIPLPTIVIDLGFADYLDWLKDGDELALFPSLRPKGERGELFASFGGWWSAYLDAEGARTKGKRPAREFRPTWATVARECGLSREAQDYLMGHAPVGGDMNARYGSREPLAREIYKLSFDGWGLEKVRRWVIPSE